MTLTERISTAFDFAEKHSTKASQSAMEIESQIGYRSKIFLNRLVWDGCVYLEVGLRNGGSFVCALMGNRPKLAVGIDILVPNYPDDYSSMPDRARVLKQSILKNTGDHLEQLKRSPDSIRFIFEDCFKVEPQTIPWPVDVFFYDGAHDKEDHKKALIHFLPAMNSEFVYIVDDWKWEFVRQGTTESIHQLGLTTVSSRNETGELWGNGLFVAHLKR